MPLPSQLFRLLLLLTLYTLWIQASDFMPRLLVDDPQPEPPFAHEVEVTFLPVSRTQVLGEEMAAIMTLKNLSPGSVCLPYAWHGGGFLPDLQIEVDPEFAAQHGISIWAGEYSIAATLERLLPSETAHATINLECYMTFTKPVRPPIPITWRLTLRKGEEKRGHFVIYLQTPKDPLDELMEQHMREQDRDLLRETELPILPKAVPEKPSSNLTTP
jgi:hypothetical protein